MPSNNKRLSDAKLYLILDAQVLDHAKLLHVLKDAVRAKVDIVQLRDKFSPARDILAFCRHARKITRGRSLFILNDRCDLAKLAGVDGVHVGQQDIPCRDARRLVGSRMIVGVSCQNVAHARQAVKDGADYIGFGSVFKTLTKPEREPMDQAKLRAVYRQAGIPVFAIGGINRANASSLTALGVDRMAVCRDILLAKDTGGAVGTFKEILRG